MAITETVPQADNPSTPIEGGSVVEVADLETIKPEVITAVEQILRGQIPVEGSEVLQANIGHVHALVQRLHTAAGIETPSILTVLKRQYEALSVADRTYIGPLRKRHVSTWDEVVKAIPNLPDFLAAVESLAEPQIYFIDQFDGHLVLADGKEEIPMATFTEARDMATRISYIDKEGNIVIANGYDTEIPPGVKVLSTRGLINLREIEQRNRSQRTRFWLEKSDLQKQLKDEGGTERVSIADRKRGNMSLHRSIDNPGSLIQGVIRALRIPLKFAA